MSLIAENSMQIDVNNSSINNAVAVQGDHIGRKIRITLLSQGEVVDLTGCTATVKCSANGKTIAVNSCDINANVVTVELTKTMLAFVGKIKMQVSVTDSGGAVISTPIIYLIVSESISTEPVEQTPDFSILADLTGRIMAVLNDPAVGDTEVKDARGGYTVLGDRLKAVDNATAEIVNTLGKHTHTKNIYTDANWSLYNGITMTPHSDGGYVSFNGTANTSSQTFLLSLDESIKLNSNKATFALAKIRLRAVGANVTISFRDDAFFNSTNVIATNAQTITRTWITDKLADGEWRTIWVVTGGDKTITKLGIQPLPTTSDYELQVSSVDCYYSGDGAEVADVIARIAVAEGNISSLQNSVKANADNITSLQTTTSENTANISDLQSTVNGSASTGGTVKNQIAKAKTEIVEESINPLAERVTAAEGDITKLKNADNSLGQRIGVAETDITQLKSRATTAENNISTNTTNITSNTAAIADLRAYVGYTSDDILGLQVDYENKTFTRLAGAVGKNAGADFDSFAMYGGRRRCNVADDGTINAYYGDEGYTDDGSNGQVMVYQPAFYYKVVPLKLDKNTDSGIGYHIRKANYYVSTRPKTGFKLHPAFYDVNGNAVDYILLSAYEGSMYDVSGTVYVNDGVDTDTAIETGDLLCSVAGKKPISGLKKALTKANLELMAQNRGANWHLENIKATSANQLLMIIELGTMNTQTAIGQGVVSISDNTAYNCASLTGSTASIGNGTGQATETTNEIGGTETAYTASGKLAVTYRGVENPWGNIWKHIQGINIWGNGSMGGGQPYVAEGFTYNESKNIDPYHPVGFTLANANGYVNAMGYGSEEYDWLFMPSEIGGSSALPVGDYFYVTPNLNGYRIALLGGGWNVGGDAGGFCWRCSSGVGNRYRSIGCRLLYVPAARV